MRKTRHACGTPAPGRAGKCQRSGPLKQWLPPKSGRCPGGRARDLPPQTAAPPGMRAALISGRFPFSIWFAHGRLQAAAGWAGWKGRMLQGAPRRPAEPQKCYVSGPNSHGRPGSPGASHPCTRHLPLTPPPPGTAGADVQGSCTCAEAEQCYHVYSPGKEALGRRHRYAVLRKVKTVILDTAAWRGGGGSHARAAQRGGAGPLQLGCSTASLGSSPSGL